MTKKLIDSNVLIHAYDNSDMQSHQTAKEIVKQLEESGEGVLSAQNLAEFSRMLSEKAKPRVPYGKVRTYVLQLETLFEVIKYDSKTVAEALNIAETHGLHFFDSLLVATMEKNFISEIVTRNQKDFSKIPWLKVINPFNSSGKDK